MCGIPLALFSLSCLSYNHLATQVSNLWLLTQLLELLHWPAGVNSKIITLAQCRCPTAHLLVEVDSIDETGNRRQSSTRSSSRNGSKILVPSPRRPSSGHVFEDLADAVVEGRRDSARSSSLLVRKNSVVLVPRASLSSSANTLLTMAKVFEENKRRTQILLTWQQLKAMSGDARWVKVIDRANALGLDLDFPTAEGETILYKAAENRYSKSVERLLELNANANLQVTSMGNDYGNSVLHVLVGDIRAGEQTEKQLQIISRLLAHPYTNPCVYNGLGKTAYMLVSPKHAKLVAALRPRAVTWTALESVLEVRSDVDGLGRALVELAPNVNDLRLPDMLFCEHEGPEEELVRRRLCLWVSYLKPTTLHVCTSRRLEKPERVVFEYCWGGSAGPPLSIRPGSHNARIAAVIKTARESYREDMSRVLADASAQFEEEARPLYQELLADEHGAILCAIRKKEMAVEADEMTHSRFMTTPEWAPKRDLRAAIHELCAVGVVCSEGELSDLFQQGRHRLFGQDSEKAIFADPNSLQFWMGLVTLRMIGVHEKYASAYDVKMKSFAAEGEFHAAPGVKRFPRIMAKAFEYKEEFDLIGFEQQVLSPHYVIDVLRCTFELPTAKRMLEVRAAITKALPNARTKNGYSKKAKAPGGYRVSGRVGGCLGVEPI